MRLTPFYLDFSFFFLLSASILKVLSQTLPECPTFPTPPSMTGTGEESPCGADNQIFVEDSFSVSIEQCAAACQATTFCKFFTLNSRTGAAGSYKCGLR